MKVESLSYFEQLQKEPVVRGVTDIVTWWCPCGVVVWCLWCLHCPRVTTGLTLGPIHLPLTPYISVHSFSISSVSQVQPAHFRVSLLVKWLTTIDFIPNKNTQTQSQLSTSKKMFSQCLHTSLPPIFTLKYTFRIGPIVQAV